MANTKNATVATICNAITRFNLRQEQGQGWRYFIDTIEVQLPSQLEPFLQRQNVMEIVETDHLPLIVALNSHSLKEFSYEWEVPSEEPRPQPEADIHEGEPNTIQLLKMRKESKEEHRLHNSSGWLGAIVVSLSFYRLSDDCFYSHFSRVGADISCGGVYPWDVFIIPFTPFS